MNRPHRIPACVGRCGARRWTCDSCNLCLCSATLGRPSPGSSRALRVRWKNAPRTCDAERYRAVLRVRPLCARLNRLLMAQSVRRRPRGYGMLDGAATARPSDPADHPVNLPGPAAVALGLEADRRPTVNITAVTAPRLLRDRVLRVACRSGSWHTRLSWGDGASLL